MDYRPVGQTDMRVSALSFGASSLGGVFGPVDQDEAIATVHAAVDGGINYIDVSPFYGLTRAETVLGKALKQIPRDRYLLSTKCGRYGYDFSDFDFSAQRVTRSIDESLARLNVEHVDLLLAHDIEFGSLDQIVEETLPAMAKLRAAGKARYIGISGLPLKVFTEVVQRAEPGLIDAILSYCHYTLSDTSLLKLLPMMRERGVGVVNASPLGMGLLTADGPPDWHPAADALQRKCAEAAELCRSRGASLIELAVQFAVAEPSVPTTLVSTARPAEIRQNIAFAERPIDGQLLADVRAILEPVRDMTWPSGRPENN